MRNFHCKTTWQSKHSARSQRKRKIFWSSMTSWSFKSRRLRRVLTGLLITYTHWKIRKTNWKWPCKREKRKFRCIGMCFWHNTRPLRMKGIRLLLNWLREKPKSRTWESSTNLLSKRLTDLMAAKLNTLKLTTWLRPRKKENNCKEREMSWVQRSSRQKKNLKLCKTLNWHWKIQTD